MQVVEVVRAVLQEDADGLLLRLANERGVNVSTADVREAADVAEHLAEGVGPFPRHCPRADAAAAVAAYSTSIGILCEIVGLADLRDDFVEQELRAGVAERIIFEAAILPALLARIGGGNLAGIDEDADGHRDLARSDEIVEHRRRAEIAVGGDEAAAVEKDHHASGLGGVVLLGDVNPVVAHCAREDRRICPSMFRDRAARHALLRHRVGTKLISLRGRAGENGGCAGDKCGSKAGG